MKVRCIGSTAGLLGLLFAQGAVGDDFDDFLIPEHRLLNWSASLGVNGARSVQSQSLGEQRGRFFTGGTSSTMNWLSDSDPAQTTASASLGAAGAGLWSSFRSTPFVGALATETDASRNGGQSWNAFFEHRRYPWAKPWGLGLTVSGSGFYEQRWVHQHNENVSSFPPPETRTTSALSSVFWTSSHAISTNLSAGYGRVRDATAIYDEYVLERRLRESGALSRELSREARRKLASLLFVKDAYSFVRERSAKRLWKRVEEILREDGAIGENGLDAYSILRAGEPDARGGLNKDDLPRSPVARLSGFRVEGVASDRHSRDNRRTDSETFYQYFLDDSLVFASLFQSHFHVDDVTDDLLLGIQGEIHRPLGVPWQLDADVRFLVPVRNDRDGFTLDAGGDVHWLLADRWHLMASVDGRRSLLRNDAKTVVREDRWVWSYGLGADWYVEDRWSLRLQLFESQARVESPFFNETYFRSAQVQVALAYRILGAFEAPGSIPRETLATPR